MLTADSLQLCGKFFTFYKQKLYLITFSENEIFYLFELFYRAINFTFLIVRLVRLILRLECTCMPVSAFARRGLTGREVGTI